MFESVLPLPLLLVLLLLSLLFLLLVGCVKKLEMLLTMLVLLGADVYGIVLLVDWFTILGPIPAPGPCSEGEIDNRDKQISMTDCGKGGMIRNDKAVSMADI